MVLLSPKGIVYLRSLERGRRAREKLACRMPVVLTGLLLQVVGASCVRQLYISALPPSSVRSITAGQPPPPSCASVTGQLSLMSLPLRFICGGQGED